MTEHNWEMDIETALNAGLNPLGYGPAGTGKTTAVMGVVNRWLPSKGFRTKRLGFVLALSRPARI
jgi:hypothetical protein